MPKLLKYQKRWLADDSKVKLILKSRQIGMTLTQALGSLLDVCQGKCDHWVMLPSLQSAKEYIRDCADWAEKLGFTSQIEEIGTSLIEDKTVISLTAKTGKRITALSSNPAILHGKRGKVTIDELSKHPDVGELLRAALALTIHGGQVSLISTPGAEGDETDTLVKAIRNGELNYSLHEVSLDDALSDGLYREIVCPAKGIEWTAEGEAQWRQEVIETQGPFADNQLFLQPATPLSGRMFRRSDFEIVNEAPRIIDRCVRGWDLASTKPTKKNKDPDFTAGVKLGIYQGDVYVLDCVYLRDDPAVVEKTVKDTAELDGYNTRIVVEQEPGSSGKLYVDHLRGVLKGYMFDGEHPTGAKETRAREASVASREGKIKMVRAPWNAWLLDQLASFPGGSHDDGVDALVHAYNSLVSGKSARMERWIRMALAD